MAKIKNRTKRKAIQIKTSNKKQQDNRWYDGYLRIPLDQSLDENQIKNRCEFYGELADSSVRHEVLSLPHIYKSTAHVFDNESNKAVATVHSLSVSERKTIPEMSSMAFDAAREGESRLDLTSSYIVVRARKLTERDKLAIKAESLLERKLTPLNVLNYSAVMRG